MFIEQASFTKTNRPLSPAIDTKSRRLGMGRHGIAVKFNHGFKRRGLADLVIVNRVDSFDCKS